MTSLSDLPNANGVGPILTASTISFTAPSTIGDTGNGLAVFAVGQTLRISGAGSGANDGLEVTVATVLAGTITVDEATIGTQAAGGSVTLTRLNPIVNTGAEAGFENPNFGTPRTRRR